MSDTDLELPPEVAGVEALLKSSRDAAPGAADALAAPALAAATLAAARADAVATDLPALVARHGDEALAFLEALLGDRALARDVLDETLAGAARRLDGSTSLDLVDLLGLARAHGVAARRLLEKSGGPRPTAGDGPPPADGGDALAGLPPDTRALLLLRHGLGLPVEDLARAGVEAPRAALEAAAAEVVLATPAPAGGEAALAVRLAAREVAGLATDDERARLAALAGGSPAVAVRLQRLRDALGVGLSCTPPAADLLARVEERLAIDAERQAALARVALRVTLRCTYCHDGLPQEEATHCAACLAPHHADCFAAHGRCGAPGCAGVRTVRSEAAVGRPREPRGPGRWWLGLAGGVLGGAVVAAAALTLAPGRDAGVATSEVESAREASARRAQALLTREVSRAKERVAAAEAFLADAADDRRPGGDPPEVDAKARVGRELLALEVLRAREQVTAAEAALADAAGYDRGGATDGEVEAARAGLEKARRRVALAEADALAAEARSAKERLAKAEAVLAHAGPAEVDEARRVVEEARARAARALAALGEQDPVAAERARDDARRAELQDAERARLDLPRAEGAARADLARFVEGEARVSARLLAEAEAALTQLQARREAGQASAAEVEAAGRALEQARERVRMARGEAEREAVRAAESLLQSAQEDVAHAEHLLADQRRGLKLGAASPLDVEQAQAQVGDARRGVALADLALRRARLRDATKPAEAAALACANVLSARRRLIQRRRDVAAGDATRLDVELAEAELQRRQAELVQAEADLSRAPGAHLGE